jgi:ParB family chromosome partitioning protein
MADNFAEKRFNAVKRGELLLFDPDKLVLVEDKAHPLYDDRVNMPVSEPLVRSIAAQGVLEPVVVRRNGEAEDGTPIIEVVDGRQRVRAARAVNARKANGDPPVLVPAVIRRGDEGDAFGAMVATNELRVATDAMSNARKLKRYLDMGYSEKDAEVVFGTDSRGIRNLVALLQCARPVQRAVEMGDLPLTVARTLSALPTEEQTQKLEEMRASGQMRGAAAREQAAQARGKRGRLRAPPAMRCRGAKEVAAARDSIDPQVEAPVRAVLDWVLGKRKTLPGG